MIDRLFDIGVSNAAFALLIALIAFVVSRNPKRAYLAHMLWLLVFLKLLTPAFFTWSIAEEPPAPESVVVLPLTEFNDDALPVSEKPAVAPPVVAPVAVDEPVLTWEVTKPWLIRFWLLGSVILILWSLWRVLRFHRLLACETEAAPPEVIDAARTIASCIGLKSLPRLRTTRASIAPMVWWSGGRVQVILPVKALQALSLEEWRWALAHELAHVKRRDYLVRWVEWLACMLFWWNPVIWLAQRQLRNAEEVCCDHLVLATLKPEPRHYAKSILSVVESLLRPVHRPPAMASHVNSGGNLERRMKLIVQRTIQRKSRVLQLGVLLAAAAILPLGIVRGQEEKPDPRHVKYDTIEAKILRALEAGKISAEEAQRKLIETRTRIYDKAPKEQAKKDRDRRSDLDRETKFEAVIEDLKAEVEAGKISREDALEQLTKFKKSDDRAKVEDHRRHRFEEASKELRAAVAAGKITAEDAKERLQQLKERMAAAQDQSDRAKVRGALDLRKKQYSAAQAELRAAVEAGKISKDEARNKLVEIKGKLFPDRAESETPKEDRRKRHYQQVEAELKRLVEAERVSQAEAEKKLEAVRRELFPRAGKVRKRSDDVYDAEVRDYYKLREAELKKVVEARKITEEQAHLKLQEARKKLREKVEKVWENDARKKDQYHAVEAELKKALEERRITEEQFHERLKRLRQKLWPDRAP